MRMAMAVFLFWTAAMGSVQAQTANLVGGETTQFVDATATSGLCYVGRGPSAFQRNAKASKAYVTFDEVFLAGKYDLSGQAVLTFATAASGTIAFKNLPELPLTISRPIFSKYSQAYNAATHRLTVKFTIKFPSCSLVITGNYDGA
jgi:hypothetical protein